MTGPDARGFWSSLPLSSPKPTLRDAVPYPTLLVALQHAVADSPGLQIHGDTWCFTDNDLHGTLCQHGRTASTCLPSTASHHQSAISSTTFQTHKHITYTLTVLLIARQPAGTAPPGFGFPDMRVTAAIGDAFDCKHHATHLEATLQAGMTHQNFTQIGIFITAGTVWFNKTVQTPAWPPLHIDRIRLPLTNSRDKIALQFLGHLRYAPGKLHLHSAILRLSPRPNHLSAFLPGRRKLFTVYPNTGHSTLPSAVSPQQLALGHVLPEA